MFFYCYYFQSLNYLFLNNLNLMNEKSTTTLKENAYLIIYLTILIYFSALINEYDGMIADTKRNEIKI
jgi:hypothetical protein